MTERQSEPTCRENYVYVHVAYHTLGQKCCKKADNKSFKNVAKFWHFGMTVTNQPSIHKEIEGRLNLRNSYYPEFSSFSSHKN